MPVILLALYAIVCFPIALWTDSNLDFWFTFFKGETVDIPFWLSYIGTFCFNGFGIVGNIIMSLFQFAV